MQRAMPPKGKLFDQVRDALRRKRYSIRTERAYLDWIERYLAFHHPGLSRQAKKHPLAMGASEIKQFLTHLAVDKHLSASTQNQALAAILFLYREVLHKELDVPLAPIRAKQPKRLPTVLTPRQVHLILRRLAGTYRLIAQLLYGSGLRLMECLRLRVRDIDFAHHAIIVRNDRGEQDRVTVLPDSLIAPLQEQLQRVKQLHDKDLANGNGAVSLPDALARKYPNASSKWRWQYVFPSKRLSTDPRTGITYRHHLDESGLQKAIRQAAQRARIHKPVSCHTLRHSFAAHLLQNGYDIHIVQELLGHKDTKTTMIYTRVLQRGKIAVPSPLDRLEHRVHRCQLIYSFTPPTKSSPSRAMHPSAA